MATNSSDGKTQAQGGAPNNFFSFGFSGLAEGAA
jgi:hypothetical protein